MNAMAIITELECRIHQLEADAYHRNIDLTQAKDEIEKLTADLAQAKEVIAERNCVIHELQDVMEWQRDKLAECRRLLREGFHAMCTGDILPREWTEKTIEQIAAKAAGGE